MNASSRLLTRLSGRKPWWRKVDVILVGATVAILLSGLLMVLSATRSGYGEEGYTGLALRQAIFAFAGLGIMALVARFDYRNVRRFLPLAYGVTLVGLLAVISPLGSESRGAQAWFQLAGFQLQPSEFAKIVLILALSAYCARQSRGMQNRHVVFAVMAVGAPIALILLQPDLGTVLVFAAIAFLTLLVAGAPARALVALVLMVVVVAVAAIQFGVLQQYQLDRLGAFLDPTSNTERSAYNLNQSKIAIGSGQLVGKGLFLGTQTNLRFVPEQHTDFIFTVVGEELGLIGCATLLVLFAVLMWRIWVAACDAPDRFGRYICAGVLGMFVFQIFENVGMTMGIMPITGIPLPLMSYGGSAIITCCVALGLVLNVRYRSNQ